MVKKYKKIEKNLQRPPVVVVLGHVDHGKSSLLEAIKDFKITSKESGGITQHIGAYEVEEKGKMITFIDTPGHEAFSAMRARGTEVADIALLVVDSAQSVQPQTKEAVMAIKRAEIPMIVVLNKIDLPSANPEKIKTTGITPTARKAWGMPSELKKFDNSMAKNQENRRTKADKS